jgi:hypothetical protein
VEKWRFAPNLLEAIRNQSLENLSRCKGKKFCISRPIQGLSELFWWLVVPVFRPMCGPVPSAFGNLGLYEPRPKTGSTRQQTFILICYAC